MNEPQIELVEPKRLSINIPGIGAPVTIGAECDEVVILVRLTLGPRDNVMNVDLDVSASGDGAPVSRFDQNSAADISRDWGSGISHSNSLANVKEHAPLSAGASVDHGVEDVIMEDHVNRTADMGCCVSTCSLYSASDKRRAHVRRVITSAIPASTIACRSQAGVKRLFQVIT
jgi:hypothetical protein